MRVGNSVYSVGVGSWASGQWGSWGVAAGVIIGSLCPAQPPSATTGDAYLTKGLF